MSIWDGALFTELSDNGSNCWVMAVINPRKEMMLDLVVKTPVNCAQNGPSHVGGASNLKGTDNLAINFLLAWRKLRPNLAHGNIKSTKGIVSIRESRTRCTIIKLFPGTDRQNEFLANSNQSR